MKFYLKIVIFIIIFHISYFIFPNPAFAQGEIESSQKVFYQVLENGKTKVRHEIALTNLTTNYYASEYSFFLGFADLKNVEASDSQGPVKLDVTPKEDGTQLHLAFNDQVVGKGKSLYFSILYETEEIASKNGRVWEIDIPKIKDSPDIKAYTVSISVPPSFGKPSYIKPKLSSSGTEGLTFEKTDATKGVSITFGNYQLLNFSLSYHLSNKRLYPIVTEIALPPTTEYQEVLIDTLTPSPLTVYQDKDGNWLAKYRLEASKKLDIKAQGKAKIFLTPQSKTSYSKEDLQAYLKPQKYWEALSPSILEKAKELKTPHAIYDYIVNNLHYDFARIEKNLGRAGAASVLASPDSAICMEFTDLFIALSRAADIPAREVDGFAYTKNSRLRPVSLVKDILHAWPQYYDKEKNVWVSIDPTWGNTSGVDYFDTFDLNHFAFVVKGLDSEYPSPAGSYKESSDLEKKDVEVSFAKDDLFSENRSISISTDIEKTIIAGFPVKGNILIENHGNSIFKSTELFVKSGRLLPATQTLATDPIPPFGKAALPITFKNPSYLDNFTSSIKAKVSNQDFEYTIQVLPIFLVYLPWIGGGIGAAFLFIFARKAWSIYIQRQDRSSSLRGQGKLSSDKSKKLF